MSRNLGAIFLFTAKANPNIDGDGQEGQIRRGEEVVETQKEKKNTFTTKDTLKMAS